MHKIDSSILTREIGVLMSVYNGQRYIVSALDSLINQKFDKNKFFIFVVDDGSIDDTPRVLEVYRKKVKNLVIQRNLKNEGLGFSLNKAIAMMRPRFLVRFDADDIACNNLLYELYTHIGKNVFCHPYMYIFNGDSINNEWIYKVSDFPSFFASGVLFMYDSVAKYRYSNLFWEEFDLYLKIFSNNGSFKIIPKPLFYHRIHGANMTADRKKAIKGYRLLQKKWGIEVLKRYNFSLDNLLKSYEYCFN